MQHNQKCYWIGVREFFRWNRSVFSGISGEDSLILRNDLKCGIMYMEVTMKIICGILLIVLVIPIGAALAVGPAEEPPSLEARIEKLEAEVVWLKTRDAQVRAALLGVAEIADKNTDLFILRFKRLEDVVFQVPLKEGEHKG